ncbi:2184_t:CDS:2, partial [Entrophospora sp. SA101]
LGLKFGIAETTVCSIVRNKEKWLAVDPSDINKQKDKLPKSVPSEEIIIQEQSKLQEIIQEFPLEDVYNCDKTGKFYL